MKAKKKSVLRPSSIKTYDAGGDLSKRWFVEWYCWDENKPRRSYRGINKHRTAGDRYNAIQGLIAELTRPDPDADCFPLIIDLRAWLRAKSKSLKEKTLGTYESKLRKFEKWYEGQPMTSAQAETFLDWLIEEEGLSRTSRNHFRVFMKMGYKWMIKKGMYAYDPFENSEKVKSVSIPARPFSKAQAAHLKKEMAKRDPQLWLFCQMMYYTFIRPKELRLLIVGDILWDEWRVLIRREVSKNTKEQYVIIPEKFREEVKTNFYGENPTLFLFSNNGGVGEELIGKNSMSRRHRQILKSLRYSPAHKLYSWKHTGAKEAAVAGANIKDLQVQLRHHSLDQVDMYLRGLGVQDLSNLASVFPGL